MSLEPKICPVCGESFTPTDKRQIYCSKSCKHKANYSQKKDYCRDYYMKNNQKYKDYQKENHKKEKPILERICPICGNVFSTHDSRKKYCSDDCVKEGIRKQSNEQNKKNRILLTKTCPICNKEFETTRKNQVFCSDECYKINQSEKEKIKRQTSEYKKAHIERQNRYIIKKNPPVEKICPICKTVFTTTAYRSKYCSKKCQYEAQKIRARKK